jgi:hypothetical protein
MVLIIIIWEIINKIKDILKVNTKGTLGEKLVSHLGKAFQKTQPKLCPTGQYMAKSLEINAFVLQS